MKLSNVKINKCVPISSLNIQDIKIKRRICDLGLYSGQVVKVLKKSILKKVILISVKNYTLCIQTKIADCIEVEFDE